MKMCVKCNENKADPSWCKPCKNEYNRQYRLKRHANKELLQKDREQTAQWYKDNKKLVSEKRKAKYEADRHIHGRIKRETIDKENQKRVIREYKRKWAREYRKDPLIRLKENIRSRTRNFFTVQRKSQKNNTTLTLLGIEAWEELYIHLILTAQARYGYWCANEDYHIDHIIPLSSAKTPEEMNQLCRLENLQLLTKEDNLKKGPTCQYQDIR